MKVKALIKSVKMETLLYFREFFGPFFSVVFPIMMLILFGSIYGNEPDAWFDGRGSMDVSVPAYLGMVIAVGGLMTLPLGLIEYQSGKIYKRFDATPIGKENIVLVQILVCLVACIISSIILVAAGKILYDIHIDGQWFVIIPLFLISLASIFSIGFLITALFKNTKVAQAASWILYFLMLFTSGATLPAELFPEGLKTFTDFLPLTHVVEVLQCSFYGDPLDTVGISIAVILVVTLVCTTAGVVLYKRRKWA